MGQPDKELKLPLTDGVGELQRGGYPTNQWEIGIEGEGDNKRQAGRADGIPATFGYAIPPPGWADGGVPGLFADPKSPFYHLHPQVLSHAEIDVQLVFPFDNHLMPELIEFRHRVRFDQKLVHDPLAVDGAHDLCLDTLKQVKLLFISCVAGSGQLLLNKDAVLPLAGRSLALGYDLPGTTHSTYLYFNYTGGVISASFSGEMQLYVSAFG